MAKYIDLEDVREMMRIMAAVLLIICLLCIAYGRREDG